MNPHVITQDELLRERGQCQQEFINAPAEREGDEQEPAGEVTPNGDSSDGVNKNVQTEGETGVQQTQIYS